MSVLLGGLHLWKWLSAAWGRLYSAFVRQVGVASFVSANKSLAKQSSTEPSEQQPLPDFPSVEAAMGLALGQQFGKAGLLC